MAVKTEEQESIKLYRKSSIFRNIKRKDEQFWEDSDICEFEVFNEATGESIDSGEVQKTETSLEFALRYTNTGIWERNSKYILIIRITNIESGYSDVVYELTCLVK